MDKSIITPVTTYDHVFNVDDFKTILKKVSGPVWEFGHTTYLKEGDDTQWVERETESSRDLMESKLINIGELRQRYVDSRRIVNQKVQDIMKLMRVEEIIEGGVDYTTMYTEEEINDMAGF